MICSGLGRKVFWTYDQAIKINFKMYVWYHYSLHDLPTYGIFCGWCVHGKYPCPVCKAALRFIWLMKGGKYSSFDKHQQFLPLDHPFKQDIKNFTKGVVITDPASQIMVGAVVRAQLDALRVNEQGGGFVGYGEQQLGLRSQACGGSDIWMTFFFHIILM